MRLPYYLLFLFVLLCTCVRAQMTVGPGGSLSVAPRVEARDILIVSQDLTVKAGGTLYLNGLINVYGDFDLAGTLDLTVSGDQRDTQFGNLFVDGTTTLAASLNVARGGGYDPIGQVDYAIINAFAVTGAFVTENLPDADWSVVTTPTQVLLRLDKAPPAFELAFLRGEPAGRYVELDWGTTIERGSSYFGVERLNGSTWTEIGRVNATGDESGGDFYTFPDRNPGSAPTVTYRLRMVADDASFTHSESISVERPTYGIDDVLVATSGSGVYVQPGAFVFVIGKDIDIRPGATLVNGGLVRGELDVRLDGAYATSLSGTTPILDYGYLVADNEASISGELTASLAADYLPAGETVYTLVAGAEVTGAFTTPAALPPGDWQMEYTPTEARLVANRASPAPVTWIAFTGTPDDGAVDLDWTTGSEENSDYFGVERQHPSGDWAEIGRVSAVGFSTEATDYDFTDPAPGATDPVLYRLRQVDFDGTFDYSSIVAVRLPAASSVSLFPNPATRTLFLSGRVPGRAYRITDVTGRTLLSGRLADTARPRIDLPVSLATGVYFLHFEGSETQRFQVIR